MVDWPEWWLWEIESSPHLLKRMVDRGFSEADLRLMLEDAAGYHINHEPGRWVIETMHAGMHWEVVVEPDTTIRVLVIVTAYPIVG
jgi:hypothetical protein